MKKDEQLNKFLFSENNGILKEELNNLILLIDKEIKSHPSDSKEILIKGLLLFKLKKYEDALNAFNKALEFDSLIFETWLTEGDLLLKVEYVRKINAKYEEEIENAKRAVSIKSSSKSKIINKLWKARPYSLFSKFGITPSSPPKMIFSDPKYEKEKKEYENLMLELENAKNYLNKISESSEKTLYSTKEIIFEINSTHIYNSDDYQAWNQRGNILKKYRELEKSKEAFEKAIKIRNKKFLTWYREAEEAFREECYLKALSDLDKAISIKKDELKAWSLKGIVLYRLKMYRESLDVFDKILELNPEDARMWSLKGEVLNKLGQSRDAIVAYDKSLNFEPVNANVLFKKANVLFQLNLFEEALDGYNRSLDIKTENYKVWFNKGNTLYTLCRYEESLQAFQKSLNIKTKAGTLFKIGECFKNLCRYDEALIKYEEAAELYSQRTDPMDEIKVYHSLRKIYVEKGLIFSKLNNVELATIELNKAVEICYKEASLYYNFKHFAAAIECCDEALSLKPNHINVLCKKSEALLQLHFDEKAFSIIEEVLKVHPSSDEALRVRNLIYLERARVELLRKTSNHKIERKEKNNKKADNWYDEDNYVNKFRLYK